MHLPPVRQKKMELNGFKNTQTKKNEVGKEVWIWEGFGDRVNMIKTYCRKFSKNY